MAKAGLQYEPIIDMLCLRKSVTIQKKKRNITVENELNDQLAYNGLKLIRWLSLQVHK